jgi:putative membrane protein
MKRISLNRISSGLLAIGIAVTVPAWAVSLPNAGTPQPQERDMRPPAQYASADARAGSASLVPLMTAEIMAAEMEANHAAAVDSTDDGGGTAGKPVDDIAFVRQATESGRKEIKSARDALLQLKQPELIRIAEMLVNDHSGANERLSKLAQEKQWPLPAPATPAAPPSGTASGDFDAKWTAEMIAGHERSVVLYRAEAQSGEDRDLRKYASDTLPTIERHLAELRKLQK